MTHATISRREFGRMPDGQPVHEYTMDNARGLRLRTINFGGIVTAIDCPDREGRSGNVVLGFANLADYLKPHPHVGTLVGRYANRIADACFELDGRVYSLAANDPPNALHGGVDGFGRRWWSIEPQPHGDDGSIALDLELTSADGEEGYPGTLDVKVRYTLNANNEWRIDYRANADRPTVINLTHHGYFNLAGRGTALDHHLMLAAGRFATIDRYLIPERIADVEGTPFDFRESTHIAARIRQSDPQLVFARGYDHFWIIERDPERDLQFAARLEDPASGRVLEVETTEPGLQFYSGNFLDGRLIGVHGEAWRQGDGLCLETQHHPNAPNRPDFASAELRPGQTFRSTTVYRFSTAAERRGT